MEIHGGKFCLTVLPLSESTYYRLEDRERPGLGVLLELQVWRDGFCVDYEKCRRHVEEQNAREFTLGVITCGIARLKALLELSQKS